jgi:hypothetical protein
VWVVAPELHKRAEHRFTDNSLCLYWGRRNDWTPDMALRDTIIPWTAEWLFYYELWLETGRWLGSSSHDAPAERPKQTS